MPTAKDQLKALSGLSGPEFERAWSQTPDRRRAPPAPRLPRPRPASLERRRFLAGSGYLPAHIAQKFTLGQQAALAVVGQEVIARRSCTLPMDKIAALAGVSRTLVRSAFAEAKLRGLLTVDERRLSAWRSDTNVVRVVDPEWLSWLARRGGRRKPQPSQIQEKKGHPTKDPPPAHITPSAYARRESNETLTASGKALETNYRPIGISSGQRMADLLRNLNGLGELNPASRPPPPRSDLAPRWAAQKGSKDDAPADQRLSSYPRPLPGS
jgi:hypothetical protein